MKLGSIVTSLSLSSLLAFNASAVELVNLNDFPDWFKEAMARDSKVTNSSPIEIEEFQVNSSVLGQATLQEAGEGTWYYTIDIGTDAPVECYAFSEFDGPANSLYSIAEYSLTGVEALNEKTLSGQFNYAMDVGVVDATPYLSLDTLYTVGENDEKVSGLLKGLSAETDNSLQVCIHNEMGYQGAFVAVFKSFVRAFTAAQPTPEFYRSTYQVLINDIPMGFTREKYIKDSEGDVQIEVGTAFMIPVDETSIARSDSVSISWSSPDGSLINGSEYTIENSTMASSFDISYVEDAWQVKGELQGKPVEVELAHKDWLISSYGSYLESVNLLNSESDSGAFYMWTADADPTAAIEIVISEVADNPNGNLKIDMGPLVMTVLSDKKGIISKGIMQQGGLKMDIELMHSNGNPTL
ncbi:hypothetical protein Q4561_04820 [Alteromonas sp. 1_MG-2023]|uniref:hypothetical protein n=1 Tax=Alteromonas sp. 1_MG-2023 TaxID=3062669 RepID=UPI0026E23606|nr:hypothetical protein [Alteromonas sp. 1_MG-2023]MDO6566370.1 hypothetical protein [Alteromonas sp. 1_MG-2023]